MVLISFFCNKLSYFVPSYEEIKEKKSHPSRRDLDYPLGYKVRKKHHGDREIIPPEETAGTTHTSAIFQLGCTLFELLY